MSFAGFLWHLPIEGLEFRQRHQSFFLAKRFCYILERIVKPTARICVFAFVCLAALSQTPPVPASWPGTWELNVQKSTFGEVLLPGVPAGFKIVSETLTFEPSATDIRLSGDVVFLVGSESHSTHEDNRVKLDGTATVIGPLSLSFRRIDNSTFDIISAINIPGRNIGQVSRFVFSSDGRTMTETKTQTQREPVPEGTNDVRRSDEDLEIRAGFHKEPFAVKSRRLTRQRDPTQFRISLRPCHPPTSASQSLYNFSL